ncbi:Arc family DNA-binding protein [Pseudomonas sp. NC02]|uniref:Arc family DNA-binding protein n=1 Tax=Pseudomonas sp. NC02 TaxID=2067572 RepID=UPI00157FA2DF|nr:Arc family DNA-binding protein [Pseudomonas sp. NC02]
MNTQYDSRTADKFVVRLPDGLRADIERTAGECDTSMNTVFIRAVRQYLDGQQRQQLLLDALAKAVTGKEELDAVLHWRGKHTQAIRERDALQALLTAADERADTAASLIRRIVANFDTEIEYHEDVEPNDLEHDQVLADMRDFLGALKPADGDGKPCACPGCDSARRANSPFCVAHRSARSRTRGQDPLTAGGLEWLMQNDGLQQ